MEVTHQQLLDAIKEVDRLHNLGDAIYDVRSRIAESGEKYTGSSWDHPDVEAYSAAVTVIRKAIEATPDAH